MSRLRRHGGLVVLLLLPVIWAVGAGEHALGRRSVDLLGHLWHHWHAAREPLTTTTLVRFPEGVDLLPITGGWLDVWIGGRLVPWLGLIRAWNAVVGLLVLMAGIGGTVLARSLGSGPRAAVVAGVLLQLDGFLLLHLAGGRTEQLGLGLVALALAGAVRLRDPRSAAWEALPVGVCGALLVALSWELALVTAAGLLLLAPALLSRESLPRVGLALGTAALLCLPGVVAFVDRAGAARAAAGAGFGTAVTEVASVGLLEWLGPHRAGPHTLSLVALLALPWTAPAAHRRLWLGLGLLLFVSLGLALGASPSLHRGGTPFWTGPTPWQLAAHLPLLSWFHWPDRLTVAWSLAAPVAAALAVSRLARWRTAAGVLAGAVLLGSALAEHVLANRGPFAEVALAPSEGTLWLADQPGEGAVFDLPLNGRGRMSQAHLLAQLSHGRPTRAHPFLDHLVALPADPAALALRDNGALQWLVSVHPRAPRPSGRLDPAELDALHGAGFDWIVLHGGVLPAEREAEVAAALEAALGPPAQRLPRWRAWRLGR